MAGRPTKFTPELLEILKEAFQLDFTIAQACLHAGIHETTYHDWKRANPDKSSVLEANRNNMKMKAKRVLNSSINEGNANDAKWLLERREKEGYAVRQEHTGADGDDLKITWEETKSYESNEEAD